MQVLPIEPPKGEAKSGKTYEFEPEPEALLNLLLPKYLRDRAAGELESSASEHGARMTAMTSANRNAGKMIDSLTPTAKPRPPGLDHQGDPGDRRGAEALNHRLW